jgi:hypothetical protein
MTTSDASLQTGGTAAGLIEFLDWTARTGMSSGNTAASYKTAVIKVLEIDGESWPAIRIQEVDVEQQLERFTRLRAGRYSSESLTTYGKRFHAAIENYLRYLRDPKSYRGSPVKSQKAKAPSEGIKASQISKRKSTVRPARASVRDADSLDELIEYPFPFSSGKMGFLKLPRDIRRTDAARIAKFVESLAIDPIRELMPGGDS